MKTYRQMRWFRNTHYTSSLTKVLGSNQCNIGNASVLKLLLVSAISDRGHPVYEKKVKPICLAYNTTLIIDKNDVRGEALLGGLCLLWKWLVKSPHLLFRQKAWDDFSFTRRWRGTYEDIWSTWKENLSFLETSLFSF